MTPNRRAFAGVFAVTLLTLLAVGAVLPVLPRYVKGPIGSGDLAVGIVIGSYAVFGLACRPLAGGLADVRGRRPIVVGGALLSAAAGLLYFVPAGVPGLIVARMFLGIGEGAVYTAGAAWIVDLAPVERRGRIIGLYGLAIWGGLSVGPAIGEILLRATSYEMVWAFAAATPLLAALIALRIPDRGPGGDGASASDAESVRTREGGWFASEAVAPGSALAMATLGYAAVASFIVLHLDERGIGHGAAVFTAFALSVVAIRLIGGWLPDRFGASRTAAAAAAVEAVGLVVIALAQSIAVAILGAVAMGAAFSLLFPSLALLVVNRVDERRRGVAMGTFTAFFDAGVGIGAPIAGIAAALGGYGASFAVAAAAAVATIFIAISLGRRFPEAARGSASV
jgi:MFS family permease